MSDLQAMLDAFAAKGGKVTVAPEGVAYGVRPDLDRVRRAEARAARSAPSYDEGAYEREAEAIREAYHTGGRHAAIDAMNGVRG